MRTRPALIAFAALTLAGCASEGGAVSNSYSRDLAKLQSECDARGGVLAPVPYASTGRPQTDYYCDIKTIGTPRTGGQGGEAR
jgi:hypothetical protein